MQRFLIINPFGIGDCLFTTPLVRAIKDNLPDARVGYWCNERVKYILQNNKNIDKIFALSRGDLKRIYENSPFEGATKFFALLYNIQKEKYTTAFDFSLDYRYSLICKIMGIRQRIGFQHYDRTNFLTKKINIEGYNHKHVVEYYLDLLKFVDLKPKNLELQLDVPEESLTKARLSLLFRG